MLHPYKHQLLHKNDHQERLKQVENDRLAQLIRPPTTQLQITVELSSFISKWWAERWNHVRDNRSAKRKIVMPKV